VRNSDEKSADITGSTLVFNLVTRDTKDLILSKDCIVVDATKGKVYVVLTERETLSLESGFYNFTITQEVRDDIDSTDYYVTSRTPMYIDSQYGVIATLEVSGDVFGEVEDTLEITKFARINPATTGDTQPVYITSSIIDTKNNETPSSLHTFQINFSNNYSGLIKIQGSLADGATPNSEPWTDVIPEFTVTDQSTPIYKNVTGKYSFFRVRHYPSESSAIATFTVQQTIFTTYTVNVNVPGIGYHVGDVIVIKGDRLGGETPGQDLTITVTGTGTLGSITAITWTGNSYNGVKTFVLNGNTPTAGTVDKILYR
jgi:hypothetical protein